MKKLLLLFTAFVLFTSAKANRINVTMGGDNGAFVTGWNGSDTLVIRASLGTWSYMYFGGCNGTDLAHPLVIINEGNVDFTDGATIENCTYVHYTGGGTKTRQYGFYCFRNTYCETYSTAVTVRGLSHDIEVDNIESYQMGYLAWCKNETNDHSGDADHGAQYWWPHRMYNIEFHHLKGTRTCQDGMYMNSSDPYGTSRSLVLDNITSSSATIPSTNPSTVTLTVPTGKTYYTIGLRVYVTTTGANFNGNIQSYNSGTGQLVITTTTFSGSGTHSSWTINGFPRPTGMAGVVIHDVYQYFIGRSGIQWGGSDSTTAKFPVNKIYNDTVIAAGKELNDQQGQGIAFGTGAAETEIYGIVTDSTFQHGFFSYNFSQIYLHDNRFNHSGHIDTDTSGTIIAPNYGFLVRVDRSVNSTTYSSTVANQWTYVKPNADWMFFKFIYDNADYANSATWIALKQGTSTGLTARQSIIAGWTTPPGSHAGTFADPWVGFGGSVAITNAAVIIPKDGRLPYQMSTVFINDYNDNIYWYGTPRGKTSFVMERDSATGATDATYMIAVGGGQDQYDSTKSYISLTSNKFNGSTLTSGQIYKDPTATTFAYRTNFSTFTWNGGGGGGTGGGGGGTILSLKFKKGSKIKVN